LIVWALAQSRGDGHHSLVTPERVLSKYKEDFIWFMAIFLSYLEYTWFTPSYKLIVTKNLGNKIVK